MDINNHEIESVCKHNDISYLGLFGSYARGDNTEDSDVDLLVEFKKPKSFFDLADIEEEFQKIFNAHIDLVLRKTLKPRVKPYIMKDLKTLYSVNATE